MSRGLDRDEVERRGDKQDDAGILEGLSRSGAEKRERAARGTEEAASFGENQRERVFYRGREYRIRSSEAEVLRTLLVFRVVHEDDLKRGAYGGDEQLAQADFRSLGEQRLVRTITFQFRRDAPLVRVKTLSDAGYDFASSRNWRMFRGYSRASLHSSNIEHDALLYRAYLQERHRISEEGGAVRGVVLDYELKRQHFTRVNKPGAGAHAKVQAESAQELRLPVIEGRVLFPDFRVEYEDERGEPSRVDVEVATENYREKHLALKSAAGFRIYAQGSDGGFRIQSAPRLKGYLLLNERSAAFPL